MISNYLRRSISSIKNWWLTKVCKVEDSESSINVGKIYGR